MADPSWGLVRLAAELRAEMVRVDKTAAEIASAIGVLRRDDDSPPARLAMYGAAALLETFYSGVEKALSRVAALLGGLPEGSGWHRTLLEDMGLTLPGVRPTVLSGASVRALEPYLSFRHRFRNLYLFDLDVTLMSPLLERTGATWTVVRKDIEVFAETLDRMAMEIGG